MYFSWFLNTDFCRRWDKFTSIPHRTGFGNNFKKKGAGVLKCEVDLARDCLQISLLLLSIFKGIDELLFTLIAGGIEEY